MYDTSKRLSMPLLDNYSGIWLFGPPWGPERGENIGKPFYFNLRRTLVLHYLLQSRGV
jgi:hypothetical protein